MIALIPEVQAYVAKIRAASLDIWPYEAVALDWFVRRAKLNGYWDNLTEIYPLCGKSRDAALYKLKTVSESSSPMTWKNNPIPEANYSPRFSIVGDVTNVIDTKVTPAQATIDYKYPLLVYVLRLNNFVTDYREMGTTKTGGNQLALHFTTFVQGYANGTTMVQWAHGGKSGRWMIGVTTDVGNIRVIKNGTEVGTQAYTTGAPISTQNIYLLGENVDGSPWQTYNRCLFAAVGQTFSNAKITLLDADLAVLLKQLRRA